MHILKSASQTISIFLFLVIISFTKVLIAEEDKILSEAVQKIQNKFTVLVEKLSQDLIKDNSLGEILEAQKIDKIILKKNLSEKILLKYKKALSLKDSDAQLFITDKFDDLANVEKIEKAVKFFNKISENLPPPILFLTNKFRENKIKKGIDLEFSARLISGYLDILKESQLKLSAYDANVIVELVDGSMAFGTKYGLVIYKWGQVDFYTSTYTDINHFRITKPGNSDLPSNSISSLVVSKDGSLWVGTSKGLARLRNGVLENFKIRILSAKEESDTDFTDITCLFELSNGQLIIGTRNAGIIIYDPVKDYFKLIHKSEGINKWVTAVSEKPDGTLMIAVAGLGLLLYDSFEVKPYLPKNDWHIPNYPRSLYFDHKGNLWVGSDDGLIVLSEDNSKKVFTKNDVLPENNVINLRMDKKNNLWCFTTKGVAVWNDNIWQYPVFENDYRLGVICAYESKNGCLWVSSYKGIIQNPSIIWKEELLNKALVILKKEKVESLYPKLEESNMVAKDKFNRIWLAVNDRLFQYNGSKWTSLNELIKEGSIINFVYSDIKNRIWIGSNEGFFVFEGDNKIQFNEKLNQPKDGKVIFESLKGTIYIGGSGLYSFTGEQWATITDRYSIYALSVDKFGRVWFADFNYGLFFYDEQGIHELSKEKDIMLGIIEKLEPRDSGEMRVTIIHTVNGIRTKSIYDCDGFKVMPVLEK